jgi:hypothetical protein
MAIDDEASRLAEEESPGPSEFESVLLQDRTKDVQFNKALVGVSK